MACFDSGQVAVSGTAPVPLFTVDTPGPKNVTIVGSATSGSLFVGGSPNLTATTGLLVVNGFPFTLPATAQKGTTLYACSNGGSGTIYWMVGQ